MQREELYLQDIIESIAAIENFLQGVEKDDFLAIDWEAIWTTVTSRLEPLRKEVSEILENEFPDFEIRNKN